MKLRGSSEELEAGAAVRPCVGTVFEIENGASQGLGTTAVVELFLIFEVGVSFGSLGQR